ncbi:MAG: flagellar filament capping protein FliD, partial [Fervidobacterium pennivorans]
MAKLQKAYQKVSDKIRDFYNYLGNFSLQATLIPKMATVSNSILSATASASALDGVYNVEVLSLATNSVFSGQSFAQQFNTSDTIGQINTRYVPTNSTVKLRVGTNETTLNINTTDTIDDVINSLQNALNSLGASTSISFDSNTGKLSIVADRAFQITNVTGNFTFVFRLNDASLRQSGTNFTLESSGNIGAYSQYKMLSDLGISTNKTLTVNGTNITINSNDTLANVVSKINNTINDVIAFYDDKNGKIVITSKNTGDNIIDISGDSDLLNTLGLSNGSFTIGQRARVNIMFNAYTELVEANTNSISYKGLTLELSSTGSTTISVSTNKENIVKNVEEFVNKWNELMDFLYNKLSENKVTGKSEDQMSEDEKLQGLLKNDNFLRRIFDKFRGFLTQSVDGKTLASLGIESGDVGKGFQNTMRGKIVLDKDKLRTFIDDNGFDAVWNFFGKPNGDKGLAIRLKDYSYQITKFNGEID